ncbi:hypothetical protein LguiB_003725 [Lonicera macranthoides]
MSALSVSSAPALSETIEIREGFGLLELVQRVCSRIGNASRGLPCTYLHNNNESVTEVLYFVPNPSLLLTYLSKPESTICPD